MKNFGGAFMRIGLLLVLIVCFWFLPKPNSESKANQSRILPVTVKQLEPENGRLPIEVTCSSPQLSVTNQLDDFACTLRNNTVKNITAVSLIYSTVVVEKDGQTITDSHSWLVQALIHPDFLDIYQPIRPRSEKSIRAAKMSFGEETPKAVEIAVDYVEFEDGTKTGPDREGSKIVADMKYGAYLYKQWLVSEYIKRGKSSAALAELIEKSNSDLPEELKNTQINVNQEPGAKAYQALMKRLLSRKGLLAVVKHFPR